MFFLSSQQISQEAETGKAGQVALTTIQEMEDEFAACLEDAWNSLDEGQVKRLKLAVRGLWNINISRAVKQTLRAAN